MKRIAKDNGNKKETMVFEYVTNENDVDTKEITKEAVLVVQEPDLDQLILANNCLYDNQGKLDMLTPGRTIYELCCHEVGDDIINNNRLLLSIFSKLTLHFVLPINAVVKKK
jgi:hypothetical protein